MDSKRRSVIGCGLAALVLLAAAPAGYGQTTKYWQPAGAAAFTDDANWLPSGVPGELDTAAFTNLVPNNTSVTWARNVTNDTVIVGSPGGSANKRNFLVGNYTWNVTNQFIVTTNTADIDWLELTSGSLMVTNPAGTASITFGKGNAPIFFIGGTCIVDRIVNTNDTSRGLQGGVGSVLRVLHGADWRSPGGIYPNWGQWSFLGGSNYLKSVGDCLNIRENGTLIVDGPSTVMSCSIGTVGVNVGFGYGNNRLIVTNGAQCSMNNSVNIGYNWGSGQALNNNKLIVTGSNSLLAISASLNVGHSATVISTNNEVIVSDGGTLTVGVDFIVGRVTNHSDIRILITGANSLIRGKLIVGPCASAPGLGSVRVEKGGTLEPAYYLQSGTDTVYGAIMNDGGIYQFSVATPSIWVGRPGNIVLTNGTIAFRGIQDARVQQTGTDLTNITYQGSNAFRLNNATNTASAYSQAYLFDTALGSSNYCRLELVNGGTRYRGLAGDTLTIGSGGSMLVSNTAAVVDLTFTNNGTLTIVNSTLTFSKNATLNGVTAIDMGNLATTPVIVAQSDLTLGASSTLALSGTLPAGDVTLFTCAGTLTGQFGSVTGLPSNFVLRYGAGTILLRHIKGTIISVR
ncbi:MAG: hypothetical protein PHR35_09635 [Kiritimatiellae bacterium]|nr:hypothetical protein [Kiritimatiellia bacterium]